MRLRVALITSSPDMELLDGLLTTGDYDITVIDDRDLAYSQVRLLMPDVIVMCVDFEQCTSCHVLSMLKIDSATSHIPVLMCLGRSASPLEDRNLREADRFETATQPVFSMN
jgi:CheY-like chemotaxis protein